MKEQEGWVCEQKEGMSNAKAGDSRRKKKGVDIFPNHGHVYMGSLSTLHSQRMVLFLISPCRLFPMPTAPTYPIFQNQ